MRAITIDPFTEKVAEINTEGSLREIYAHTDCTCITVVVVSSAGDALYLDDEGLFRSEQRFFMFGDYPQPLAGKGIILGTDEEGDNRSTTLSLEDALAMVRWVDKRLKFSHIDTTEKMSMHPLFGDKPVTHIINTPRFTMNGEDEEE